MRSLPHEHYRHPTSSRFRRTGSCTGGTSEGSSPTFRSAAPLIPELKRLILAFDGLCQVLGGDLVEFDINPLGVDLESNRVWALDSKIVLASDEGNEHEPA